MQYIGKAAQGTEKPPSLAAIVTETFVEHPIFVKARDEIIDFVDDSDPDHPSLCIIGHARTGKTTLCQKIRALYPREPDAAILEHSIDGRTVADRMPVVVAEVPETPTAKTLGHYILKSLGDPNWNKGDKTSVTNRV